MNWLSLIKSIVPIVVGAALPGAGPIVGGLIVHGIEVAEQSGKPGTTKLSIAKEEITTAINGINAVKPNTIDATQLNSVVDQVISTSVNAANLVKNVPVRSNMTKEHATIIDLNKDLEASAARIIELKAGRDNGDIPMDDPYWKAIKKHRIAHGTKKENK